MFWTRHLIENGDVNTILILDNCTVHDIDQSRLPNRLFIKFFPLNVTNRHQPADMGMIAALKAGYKSLYQKKLLAIFDAPQGFECAAVQRAQRRRGQKGIEVGGKPHLLDCMIMIKYIWDGIYGRYVSTEGIHHCWRKANILPEICNVDINNAVGRAYVPEKHKFVKQGIKQRVV